MKSTTESKLNKYKENDTQTYHSKTGEKQTNKIKNKRTFKGVEE
jgi:hypothetical protein